MTKRYNQSKDERIQLYEYIEKLKGKELTIAEVTNCSKLVKSIIKKQTEDLKKKQEFSDYRYKRMQMGNKYIIKEEAKRKKDILYKLREIESRLYYRQDYHDPFIEARMPPAEVLYENMYEDSCTETKPLKNDLNAN